MSGMVSQLRSFIERLEPRQRMLLGVAAALSLGAVLWVGSWSLSSRYVEVFHASDPGEIQDVAAALDAQRIPYEIAADGRSISVLPQDEGRARIAGASVGKVQGAEILDALDYGTSPQRERWAYQRALQGELARTIMSLEEVDQARVHLVLPERDVFLRDDGESSASVTVRLAPGARLSKAQVRGITALVSGAVKGLSADNVVLVDHTGKLIAGPSTGEDEFGLAPNLVALRQQEENRTRNAILAALTRVFGSARHISVGVTAEVETASVERTRRSQDPDSQVVVSEVVHEQSSDDTTPGGVPGTASNLPEQPATASAGRTSSSASSEQRLNYDYSSVEEHSVEHPGKVKRLSVGVVVDADKVRELVEAMAGDGEADTGALRKTLEQRIEDTVRVAMGYDEERGDVVEVSFLPFSEPDEIATAGVPEGGEAWRDLVPYGVALLGLLLFFGVVARPLVQTATRLPPPNSAGELEDGEQPARLEGGEGSAEGVDEAVEEAERPGYRLAERLRSMVDNYESVEAHELNQLVRLEEETTAQVLRRWIRNG